MLGDDGLYAATSCCCSHTGVRDARRELDRYSTGSVSRALSVERGVVGAERELRASAALQTLLWSADKLKEHPLIIYFGSSHLLCILAFCCRSRDSLIAFATGGFERTESHGRQ